MPRRSTGLSLTLVLALAVSACSQDTPQPTELQASANRQSRHDDDRRNEARPTSYAVIGDVPYEPRAGATALSLFPTLVNAINADAEVTRAIHVGDIKSGSTLCSDDWFSAMSDQFGTFADPLVYSIGDNEWTDCHRANNGGYNPIERLLKLRRVFFRNPGFTLGKRERIDAQPFFPENQAWSASNVTFATFHVIGSNNGREAWFGDRTPTPGETRHETVMREFEVAVRSAANMAWLERTFREAREDRSAGVVLFVHADLWHPDDRAAGADFSAHSRFVSRLAFLAKQFGKPVLIISGDSHNYRVDVGVPWFSEYGVTPPANVTQIIVDRTIEADIEWLKLNIDPNTAAVFTWTREIFVP